MAGKSASMHGLVHDATPFTFSEDVSAIDYFGKMLVKGEVPMRNCLPPCRPPKGCVGAQ